MSPQWIALALLGASAPQPTAVVTLGSDLAHARALARSAGERIWPGYGTAPFGMLLVAGGTETLFCQPEPPASFAPAGSDAATGCAVMTRPRSGLPDNLLAAMPVFGPPATIVMGTPEATGFSRTNWLRTILHEHFHQWQMSRPGYFDRVDGLGLKGIDTTGMWMLNFPFPYEDAVVAQAYARASVALADVLALRHKPGFIDAFDRFLAARDEFSRGAGARNWRYLDFVLWQEGGARWTEYAIASADTDPSARRAAADGVTRTLARLRSPDLKAQGRELAYTYGTGEIMLLDACGPAWRRKYASATGLGRLLAEARASCGTGGARTRDRAAGKPRAASKGR